MSFLQSQYYNGLDLHSLTYQIRHAQLLSPSITIRRWLFNPDDEFMCVLKKQQLIIDQYNVLLEVFCDDYLPLSYRKTCLHLINFPLFWLRELEESFAIQNDKYTQVVKRNIQIFFEFTTSFAYFKKSLGV